MLRTILCFLTIATVALAQGGGSKANLFRTEGPALQRDVDQVIGEVPGISLLQTSKASYIEEFGIVVSLEVALEQPRNPFTIAGADRITVPEKQRQIREKIKQFLTQRASRLQTVGEDQSVVIVVHVFNANPVDAPNLARQMMFMVKKKEASNLIMREL